MMFPTLTPPLDKSVAPKLLSCGNLEYNIKSINKYFQSIYIHMGSCKWLVCKTKLFAIHVHIHSRAGSKVTSQIPALQITTNLSVNSLFQTSLCGESNTAVKVKDSPLFTIAVIIKICIHTPISFKGFNLNIILDSRIHCLFKVLKFLSIRHFFYYSVISSSYSLFTCIKRCRFPRVRTPNNSVESFLEYPNVQHLRKAFQKSFSRIRHGLVFGI